MSSRYPILDDRPIDQWNVTELKAELKKRKLATKGLKDGLIKRLDESIRIEGEDVEASDKDEVNGFNGNAAELNHAHTETVVAEVADTLITKSAEMVESAEKGIAGIVHPVKAENSEMIPEVDGENSDKLYGATKLVDINSSAAAMYQEVEHMEFPAGASSANVGDGLIVHSSTRNTTITATESVLTETRVGGPGESYSAEPQNGDGQNSVTKKEDDELKVCLVGEESKSQLECDLKPSCEHLMPSSSLPENQVSKVNPSLGSQVKSDSISSNSVSINQKNELKNTIIADNVKFEQDIIRPDMVEDPSSRNDVPVYDESHSMDVGELHEKKASFVENSSNKKSPNLKKTSSSEEVGYPEKLNLDKSSGDDSMEEGLPESKPFDSKFNVDEFRDMGESVKMPIVTEEGGSVMVEDSLSSKKGATHHNNSIPPVVGKRKFHDQASVENTEPAKRQRRWNSETVKGSDPQRSILRPATTPKDEPIALKRDFSGSDFSAIYDTPTERIVPPPQRAPTNSLRIDRFLRPFTLKAVQELLGKTGNVSSFWMDHIKTHCYVTYSSVEEAIETRNAVYNLQWPPKGGRLLVAEYVEPQQVKMKLEAPPQVASVNNDSRVPPVTPTLLPELSTRQHWEQPPVPVTLPPLPPLSKLPPEARLLQESGFHHHWEQPPAPATLQPPPPLSMLPPAAREWLPPPPPLSMLPPAEREWLPPPPPPLPEKVGQPIVTLDDLFRKTKATPRIYYLPLSKEQVQAKLRSTGQKHQAVGY